MNKPFARFAKKAKLTDGDLWTAARLADSGLIDADLGGGVIKQRIARAGEGKSGGMRTIILFRRRHRAVFIYGFAKKDLANIKQDDLPPYRALARIILGYTDAQMADYVSSGAIIEVKNSEEWSVEETSK